MMKSEVFERDSRHPPLPGHKEHRCTDSGWLVLLCLALCGLVGIQVHAYIKGDVRRLSHGYNYMNQMCGVDKAVQNRSFVFWCKDQTGMNLSLAYPICVESCPADNRSEILCFDPAVASSTTVATYASKPMGQFCLPEKASLVKRLLRSSGHHSRKVLQVAAELQNAWMILASAGVMAALVGYGYLLLLDHCAGPLVQGCLLLLAVAPLLLGAWLLCLLVPGLPFGGENELSALQLDRQADLILGCCLVGAGLGFSILACWFASCKEAAVGCIEAACECLFQEASLTLEPLIALSAKASVLASMGAGLLALVSCGRPEKAGEIGIMKRYEWTHEDCLYMAYFGFMTIWLLELGNATSQYVLAWVTQMWYFTPYVGSRKLGVPSRAVCKGYSNVLSFHMGTVALGSLLVMLFRSLRMALALLARSAQVSGNCVATCSGGAFTCCMSSVKNHFQFMSKSAYLDVAISSEGFCASGRRAAAIISDEVPAVAALHGAQAIFQIAGVGIVAALPGLAALFICKRLPYFCNEESPHFVERPKWVALAAALIGAVVGASIMAVFDTVGDAVLYCFAVDQRRHRVRVAVQAFRPRNYAQPVREKPSGFFGWFMQKEEEVQDLLEERVEYAPPRLRQLIQEHSEWNWGESSEGEG